MPDAVDSELVQLLRNRSGVATVLKLRGGETLRVLNIAESYDMGEPYAHISTNVSPSIEGESFGFFHTYEVVRAVDPNGDEILYEASSDADAAAYWLRSLGYEPVVIEGDNEASVTLRAIQNKTFEHPKYGRGQTAGEAILSAARRWRTEQIGE